MSLNFSLLSKPYTNPRNEMGVQSLRNHLFIQIFGAEDQDFDPLPLLQKMFDESFEDGGSGSEGSKLEST